jgi:hypothetical protein
MAERIHRTLGVVAFVIVATGFYGWRSLRTAAAVAPASAQAPVASPQLQQLIPYAVPLADSQLALRTFVDSAPVQHDPFTAEPPAHVAADPHEGTLVRAPAARNEWHVSATLISSARRAAIINDVLTYVGDPVPGGGKLVSVENDRVVLTDSKGASHTVMADKEGT